MESSLYCTKYCTVKVQGSFEKIAQICVFYASANVLV